MSNKLLRYSFIHSVGVLFYIFCVAMLMNYGDQIFGKMDNILGPIAFLLLFVISALIVSMLVLGKPIILYLDQKKKEAIELLIYTVAWLLAFTLLFFVILIIF
ncbi:hypothetical protein ACFL14_00605 [Patescibacteria group bacterium]